MALSLGVNAAAFSLARKVLFQPTAVANPGSVIRPFVTRRDQRGSQVTTDLLPRRAWNSALPSLRAFDEFALEIGSDGLLGDLRPPLKISQDGPLLDAVFVSHNYFRALGIPITGQGFAAGDDRPAGRPAVIVSDVLWRSKLAGDRAIIGQEISLGGTVVRLTGVAPPGFGGPLIGERRDVWVSLGAMPEMLNLPLSFVEDIVVAKGFGRLAVHVSPDQAASELSHALGVDSHPESLAANAYPVRSGGARAADAMVIKVLTGTAVAVLLLGWFNLAAIFRAEAERQQQDVRLRIALGISRRRLMLFRISHPLVLTVVGGFVATVVSEAVLRTFADLTLPSGLSLSQLSLHAGFVPVTLALLASFITMTAAAGHRTRHRNELRLTSRRMLLVGYVGASLFLVLDAGVLVRTIQRGLNMDLGFDSSSTLEVIVQPRLNQYLGTGELPTPAALLGQLLGDVRALPEVADAAEGPSPLWFVSRSRASASSKPAGESDTVAPRTIEVGGPEYFATLGIPLISGRQWSAAEKTTLARTAIVSRTVARSRWPNSTPEGQVIEIAGESFEVIGVAPDVVRVSIREPVLPSVFILPKPGAQAMVQFVVRARGDVARAADAVRDATRRVFPNSIQLLVTPTGERVKSEMAAQQLGALMFSWMAITTFALASIGVYGLVMLSIAMRWRELAIRTSLGAAPWTLVSGVIISVLRPVAAGCLVGLAGAILTSGTLRAFLFQTSPLNPFTVLSSVLLQAGVACAVALAAAWRVLHIDPVRALRCD